MHHHHRLGLLPVSSVALDGVQADDKEAFFQRIQLFLLFNELKTCDAKPCPSGLKKSICSSRVSKAAPILRVAHLKDDVDVVHLKDDVQMTNSWGLLDSAASIPHSPRCPWPAAHTHHWHLCVSCAFKIGTIFRQSILNAGIHMSRCHWTRASGG